MRKFSSAVEKKKQELNESQIISERNLYLDFAKKYHKKQGVSGPFDKKFKGNRSSQERYMEGLAKAWEEHKKEKGIKNKPVSKKFDFAKKRMNESKSLEMAKSMIGDGGDPNYHFVTMCDDFYYEKGTEMVRYSKDMMASPIKVKTTPDLGAYTFGPFANLDESKNFAASIELDEINGPRMVTIEDRKSGDVYCKYLTCKMQPVWNEIEEEDEIEEEEDYEDPNAQYTYKDEDEDEHDESDDDMEDEDEEEDEEYTATIPQEDSEEDEDDEDEE